MVQFYPWFKFYFPLFLGMVMLIMSLKQRKIKFEPKIKSLHEITNIRRYNESVYITYTERNTAV